MCIATVFDLCNCMTEFGSTAVKDGLVFRKGRPGCSTKPAGGRAAATGVAAAIKKPLLSTPRPHTFIVRCLALAFTTLLLQVLAPAALHGRYSGGGAECAGRRRQEAEEAAALTA